LNSCLLSESEARKNVNYLASLDFIISLGFGLIMPLFPQYVKLLGGGGLEVGILFSSFVLTRAILAAPFGNLSDRLGRKRLILVGSFLYALLAVLFTVPTSWPGLTLVRGLQGVASAMVWPVSEALVIDSCPVASRGASLGKIVMASNLGMVVGPFIGGGLYFVAAQYLGFSETNSFKFPFYFTAIVALIGAIMVWANVTDARSPVKDRPKISFGKLFRPDGMDRQGHRNLKVLYANAAMEGFSFASIGPLMALFLLLEYPKLEADIISIIIGTAMGLGALVAFPAGRLSDRIGRKKLFVIGGYLSFVGTILIPFGGVLLVIILLLAMRSMAFQVSSPALRALQADTVPEEVRGRLIGMLESMSNFGSVLGAPMGGLLLDAFFAKDIGLPDPFSGTMVPFLISGGLGIFTVTLVLLLVKEKPKPVPEKESA
jgi:DHA1 family multidrug resistance protein-like MFS transporter